jgi:hypothetical protein
VSKIRLETKLCSALNHFSTILVAPHISTYSASRTCIPAIYSISSYHILYTRRRTISMLDDNRSSLSKTLADKRSSITSKPLCTGLGSLLVPLCSCSTRHRSAMTSHNVRCWARVRALQRCTFSVNLRMHVKAVSDYLVIRLNPFHESIFHSFSYMLIEQGNYNWSNTEPPPLRGHSSYTLSVPSFTVHT